MSLLYIIIPALLALLGWCMIISTKRRDKAWRKTMKGKTIRPNTITSPRASESLGGKEKEGNQIYKTDLY